MISYWYSWDDNTLQWVRRNKSAASLSQSCLSMLPIPPPDPCKEPLYGASRSRRAQRWRQRRRDERPRVLLPQGTHRWKEATPPDQSLYKNLLLPNQHWYCWGNTWTDSSVEQEETFRRTQPCSNREQSEQRFFWLQARVLQQWVSPTPSPALGGSGTAGDRATPVSPSLDPQAVHPPEQESSPAAGDPSAQAAGDVGWCAPQLEETSALTASYSIHRFALADSPWPHKGDHGYVLRGLDDPTASLLATTAAADVGSKTT